MKSRFNPLSSGYSAYACAALLALCGPTLAATYYWDNTLPIEAPGFDFAGGVWGLDSFWSPSDTGNDNSGILAPTTSDTLFFGTETDGLAAGTVTVEGTVSAGSITFGLASGAITLSGGTAIDLAAASTITVNNASAVISTPIIGAATSLTKVGAGALVLSSTASTYAGGTILSTGNLMIGASSTPTSGTVTSGPLGTGTLTLSGGALSIHGGAWTLANAISVTASTTSDVFAITGGGLVLTGAMTGTGTIRNNTSNSATTEIKGDISGFQGTFDFTANGGTAQNFRFTGSTAGSMDGSQAKFVLSGATAGRTLGIGGTETSNKFKMGELSGAGGIINNVAKAMTLEVGALGTTSSFAGVIADTVSGSTFRTSFTKTGAGTLTLSGASTFTGDLTVNGGTLDITGRGAGDLGNVTVATSSGSTLGIAASLAVGATRTFNLSTGTVNHTAGTVVLKNQASGGGNMLLVNGGAVYNLNGGALQSGFARNNRGVILGVNTNNGSALAPNTFKLQSGILDLNTNNAILQVGRSETSAATNTFNLYNQTGGDATVDTVTIGGRSGTNNVTSTFTVTGGTFLADNFTFLANGTSDSVTLTLGGSAQVTLPAFPAARGASATSNLTLDFTTGYLAPKAASTAFIPAGTFTNAWLSANGAKFEVGAGNDITIGQTLSDKSGDNGTLTKSGAGTLTLTAANSYTGNTTVTGGTLKLGNGASNSSLADASTVTIAAGATLHLDFPTGSANSDTVQKLYLGTPAVQVPPGTYDNNHPIYGTYFPGPGSLTVTSGPSSSPFESWATGAPYNLTGPNAAFDADPENDGLDNGLEWILGGDPTAGSPNKAPVATRNLAGDLVLTFTREEDSIGQATLSLEYDTDLSGGFANSYVIDIDGGIDPNGVVVAINQAASPDAVTITIPAALASPGGKIFARFVATQP